MNSESNPLPNSAKQKETTLARCDLRRNQHFLKRKMSQINHSQPIGSMYGIFTCIYHRNQPNVGKYTSPMDPMGNGSVSCFPSKGWPKVGTNIPHFFQAHRDVQKLKPLVSGEDRGEKQSLIESFLVIFWKRKWTKSLSAAHKQRYKLQGFPTISHMKGCNPITICS